MKSPRTLQDAIVYFADFEHCRQFLTDLRWPDGKVTCPTCKSTHVVWLDSVRRWKCYGKHTKPQFSLKTGTIFEDSPLSLDKWLAALWLLVNCKNGVSSCEVARDIGITQKSAWFMMHRLRFALHHGSFDKFSGEVEVDETFIGGKARNMHASKKRRVMGKKTAGIIGKVAVQGLLERHGKDGHSTVRPFVVSSNRREPLMANVKSNVEPGSSVYTDSLGSYFDVQNDYIHGVIDHAESYVDGQIHTNGLENFWSLLKRGLRGTYVSVEPFHLFRYLDEQAYRYNNRKDASDFDRFKMALAKIVGKRLTWKQVIGMQQGSESWAN